MNQDKATSSKPSAPEDIPVIDGFEFIEKCGHGGEASLWKARQVSLGRIVMIKILAEELSRDPEDIKQFQFEAKVAANLKHRGLVQVYDFGRSRQSGRYYFVMEHIAGYSVGDWVRRKGRLAESDCLIVAHSVADALKHAWDHARVIHCDIKPDNIMIDSDGTIKVTDLGLARVVRSFGTKLGGDDAKITGTPNYMSPEQAKGQKHLDYRSDIYSLGATLYHMLTGVLPFESSDIEVTMRRQISEDLEHPSKLVAGLSKEAGDIVMKMMAKNPALRHQGWSEVAADIARIQKVKLSPGSRGTPENRISVSSRDLAAPQASEPRAEPRPDSAKPEETRRVTSKPKLKMKMASSAGQQAQASIIDPVPVAEVHRRPLRRRSSSIENITLTLSLALLCFLAYYGYQRLVNHRDILNPVRVKLYNGVFPAVRRSIHSLLGQIGAVFSQKQLTAEPENIGGEDANQSSEPLNSEFLAILHECEAETPKVGDSVEIRLKGQANAVKGTLARIGISGVIIGVEKGTVACPYLVMEDDLRLLFAPEERARLIMKQRGVAKPISL